MTSATASGRGAAADRSPALVTEGPALERHPWELPLLVLCSAATLLLPLAAAMLLWIGAVPGWAPAVLIAVPAAYWSVGGLRHAEQRAEAVRVSPTQFPEAHAEIRRLSADMGLRSTPDAYVAAPGRRRTGAGGHGTRRYIVVPAELVALGGRLRDPAALRFVLAHQLGHIAAGHASYWRRTATAAGRVLPLLGPALARAMEYTADNHALAHCPEGAHAVRLIAGGPHLYQEVHMGEMAERAGRDRGGFLFVHNLLSRRPAAVKRMAAIRDRTRPGRLFL
ncbi:M48 family metallopeptidase [Nocardiopsis coralliicola]